MHDPQCRCAVCDMTREFDQAYAGLGDLGGSAKKPATPGGFNTVSSYQSQATAAQNKAIADAKAKAKAKKLAQKKQQMVSVRPPRPGSAPRPSSPGFYFPKSKTATFATSPSKIGTKPPSKKKSWEVSKPFGKGPLSQIRGRRGASRSGGSSLGGKLSAKYLPAMATMDSFQGMGISNSPAGYSYPEIPQQVSQEIPNYYAMSRQARGLPMLPPESGNNDHEIAQYLVEKVQVDADKRRTVEETIYTILSSAAQSAGQANDQAQAQMLMSYANRWMQAIQKAQQMPAPAQQQQPQQDDQGETSGFSLTEWANDASNTPWLLAAALFGVAFAWHSYGKRRRAGSVRYAR